MFRSTGFRWVAGIVAAIALLAVLRAKPWQKSASRTRQELTVGFLPVT